MSNIEYLNEIFSKQIIVSLLEVFSGGAEAAERAGSAPWTWSQTFCPIPFFLKLLSTEEGWLPPLKDFSLLEQDLVSPQKCCQKISDSCIDLTWRSNLHILNM